MKSDQTALSPAAAAEALQWLAEMGADEIIAETPVDRFAAPPPKPPAAKPEAPPSRAPAPPPPQPAMTAAMPPSNLSASSSLAEIEKALEGLDTHPLKKTATKLVFSDGHANADVMFVGEAPGREEDQTGKPFVGRSGQLLDRMLSYIGLSRQSDDPASGAFITNVIYWRPPGNRTPTEQETLMCLPYLRRTIEIKRPKVIVTLGGIPTQRLLGRSDGILKLRGKWYDLDLGGERYPLLATLHPAYLLRQPAQKRLAWRDLLALKERLEASR